MTNSPKNLQNPKPPTRTLVVGSSGHAHVTCVSWTEALSVNIKDFDTVVVNVGTLDNKTIAKFSPYLFFQKIRQELSLLLNSGGTIIALTPERRAFKQKNDWRNNWEWSPLRIGTTTEAGETVQITRVIFERYLSRLKRWTFYFFVPQDALTLELMNVFGSAAQYRLPPDAYATNRYGGMLAGEIPLLIASSGHSSKYGSIIVLPLIVGLDQKEALNLILEDLIGKPQQSLPPDWVGAIPMPFVDRIDAEIAEKNAAMDSLRQEIAARKQERANIEKWKKLVYATGRELEQIFEEAVIKLGGKTKPAGAEEEFILEHNGNVAVVECKGVGKSISLDHVRQTDSHVLKFNIAAEREGKGVLFGNAWRNLPPTERGKGDTPVFPDNVIRHADRRDIALVGASEFLEVFCRFLDGQVPGDAILDAIMAQSGIVDFQRTA